MESALQLRRKRGVYYTPASVARRILSCVLQHVPSPAPSICDPACGDGVFLREASTLLTVNCRAGSLFGVDIDAASVQQAARSMECAATPGVTCHFGQGDALLGSEWPLLSTDPPSTHCFAWEQAFPNIFAARGDPAASGGLDAWRDPLAPGGFDAIVGNPPYLNIRRLSKSQPTSYLAYLRRRYQCARGGYDAYVLFLERAYELLKPGGVCGMIVPNKLAALDYARPCRRLLAEQTTLLAVEDLSSLSLFPGASVYPYIVVWKKQRPAANARVAVARIDSLAAIETPATRRIPHAAFSADGFSLTGCLAVEERVPTSPLATCATLHSGATGFGAQQLSQQLTEATEEAEQDAFDFIVSGNIDRYRLALGDVRFAKQKFRMPVLPYSATVLTPGKRQLYAAPKIVIAGMTRRLEAAWSPQPLALGVQVYAAASLRVPPFYLLALLNSKLLSHLFRTRFAAKQLNGGYFAINKSQLAQLPIRIFASDDPVASELSELASKCSQPGDHAASERRIDALVYKAYQLTASEIAEVDSAPWRESSKCKQRLRPR